jgi:hypothetical protein
VRPAREAGPVARPAREAGPVVRPAREAGPVIGRIQLVVCQDRS